MLPLPQPLRDPARRVRRDIRAVGIPTSLTSKAQHSNTFSIQARGPFNPLRALLPPQLSVAPESLVQLVPEAPHVAGMASILLPQLRTDVLHRGQVPLE